MLRRKRTGKKIIHRSPIPPPGIAHKDKRRVERSKEKQNLKKDIDLGV